MFLLLKSANVSFSSLQGTLFAVRIFGIQQHAGIASRRRFGHINLKPQCWFKLTQVDQIISSEEVNKLSCCLLVQAHPGRSIRQFKRSQSIILLYLNPCGRHLTCLYVVFRCIRLFGHASLDIKGRQRPGVPVSASQTYDILSYLAGPQMNKNGVVMHGGGTVLWKDGRRLVFNCGFTSCHSMYLQVRHQSRLLCRRTNPFDDHLLVGVGGVVKQMSMTCCSSQLSKCFKEAARTLQSLVGVASVTSIATSDWVSFLKVDEILQQVWLAVLNTTNAADNWVGGYGRATGDFPTTEGTHILQFPLISTAKILCE